MRDVKIVVDNEYTAAVNDVNVLIGQLLHEAISSAILWSLGDILAQCIERYSKLNDINHPHELQNDRSSTSTSAWSSIQWKRTARLAFYGSCIWTTPTHFWFHFLQTTFPKHDFASGFMRMMCDQIFYSPMVIDSLLMTTGLLEGMSFSAAFDKIVLQFWPIIYRNWLLWPIVQIINMNYVPLEYRMLFVNLINLPWTAYLAFASTRPTPITHRPTDEKPYEYKLVDLVNPQEIELEVMKTTIVEESPTAHSK